MNRIVDRLARLGRTRKRAVIIAFDAVAMLLALWLAFCIRLGEFYTPANQWVVPVAIGSVLVGICALVLLGVYKVVIRYLDINAAMRIALGAGAVAACWFMVAYLSRAPNLPFRTRKEALTLASIVDKETGVADERDKVAAVFINRLRRGMRLQADPTVIYGLTEGDGALGRELNRRDWEHGSVYNTYQIDGLPPGPIGNPGRASIEAVLRPADVDYLYFVADGSGGHAFARTLAEHNRNVAQWRKVKNGERPPPVAPAPPKPETAG